MIKFYRSDPISITVEFDTIGNDVLINCFKNLNQNIVKINAIVDKKIVFKKGVNTSIIVEKDSKLEIPKLVYVDSKFILLLDDDSVEYGLEKLIECKNQGYFFPAEFDSINNDRNKKNHRIDDLYFIYQS